MSGDDDKFVIQTNVRWHAALAAIILLAALVVSLWVAFEAEDTRRYSREMVTIILLACSTVFAAGVLLFGAQVLWPSRLVLSGEGLRLDWIISIPLVRWEQIERFEIMSQGLAKQVCFVLTPDGRSNVGKAWWRQLAPRGVDCCLFGGFGRRPQSILEVLRDWHSRHRQ